MWIIKVWLQSGFLLEQKKKKKMEIHLVCWANTSTDKGETMWEWAHHHDPLSPDLETRSPHNIDKMQNIQNIPGHKTNMFPWQQLWFKKTFGHFLVNQTFLVDTFWICHWVIFSVYLIRGKFFSIQLNLESYWSVRQF